MSEDVEREAMDYDVVVVGAGPAGLAAAIRLKQLAAAAGSEISVAVLEKGSEVGAHILSGVIVDPKGLNELIPDWKEKGAPLDTPVTEDRWMVLGPQGDVSIPTFLMPPFMHNHGNYVGSLANLCRWLADAGRGAGRRDLSGLRGLRPDLPRRRLGEGRGRRRGRHRQGRPPQGRLPAGHGDQRQVRLHRRGRARLARQGDPGQVRPRRRPRAAEVRHRGQGALAGAGRGLPPGARAAHRRLAAEGRHGGGGFLYHFGDHYVSVGFVIHLNYKNPWVSPFDEFQRFKHHPAIARYLEGGKRIAYGARAITEGGWQSLPKLAFPGGVLIGCSAGFVNVPRHQGQPQRHQERHAGGGSGVRGDRRRPRGRRAGRLRAGVAQLLGRQGAEAGPQRQAASSSASARDRRRPRRCSTCGPPTCWAASRSSAP